MTTTDTTADDTPHLHAKADALITARETALAWARALNEFLTLKKKLVGEEIEPLLSRELELSIQAVTRETEDSLAMLVDSAAELDDALKHGA